MAKRPVFVRIWLWGTKSRQTAIASIWISIVFLIIAVISKLWLIVVLLLGTILGYWYSIKWVDKNENWQPSQSKSSVIKFLSIIIISGAIIALVVSSFVIGHYFIPQNGMYPSLPAKSMLFVNKLAYQDPPDVKRGNIIVFSHKENEKNYVYIWRVIGLPGERVETHGQSLTVNGKEALRQKLQESNGNTIYQETIGDTSYKIAFAQSPIHQEPDVSVMIPDDQYFVMGDNRDDARDSRYMGPISFDSIIGKKF